MRAIADGLLKNKEQLVDTASRESHLNKDRLGGELLRTIFQLESYGAACEQGDWLEVRIDKSKDKNGKRSPDIRKMLVPLGPVVVFGASNFPFAYSTAGGDTACAFAAGCSVIVKAHPAHADTSGLVANIIFAAARETGMPEGIFAHIHGEGFETGKQLVQHKLTKAVGFTGSFSGGKQLFDWGNQREVPIPVFSEMGSVNPVFLLPGKMKNDANDIAKMYAASVTLSVGQFCTNPGVIVGIQGADLETFETGLKEEIELHKPAKMLHAGIAKAFHEKRKNALQQDGVSVLAASAEASLELEAPPTIARVSGTDFLNNPLLHEEVFGPYSIIVACKDAQEMLKVAHTMQGQLTSTIMGTDDDIKQHHPLVEAVQNICGRFIMNGVPTGVEVCLSMHHGGPYPATTDSRSTAVGADGIKRFARPVAFQNWSNDLLPEELKDENPLGITRTVDGEIKVKAG